jgi:hypothetical protein
VNGSVPYISLRNARCNVPWRSLNDTLSFHDVQEKVFEELVGCAVGMIDALGGASMVSDQVPTRLGIRSCGL